MQATLAAYLAASIPLYRAEQVRRLDRYAIDTLGIAGLALMQRAGAAAFGALRERWPEVRSLCVLCGAGNNGGDGYVVARLARQAGFRVSVYALAAPERLKGDALSAYRLYRDDGGVAASALPERFEPDTVLVDGLLGTGLDRPVEGAYAQAIAAINESGRPVLALDIPSGLCADSGAPLGRAVRAQLTVTFMP
ncbi:NAD(P)H-hydrate epimerase [Methylogaea oryzae]|uniref:NAD(P)H-hydrate epimerase n=1 Tax=Methylogaea oryzae TaxID=1295382 RepID=UPI0006D100B6|nr:NAD(P)H-hydrate epimerase [Methylogaea oryzae]